MIHCPTQNVGPFVELITLAGSRLDEREQTVEQTELNKSDPRIERFFRTYKGRKAIRISPATSHCLSDYWDGGSRDYTSFVNLDTNEHLTRDDLGYVQQEANNPFHQAIGEVQIKPGHAVIVNSVFCGKNMAPRMYVNPADYPKFK